MTDPGDGVDPALRDAELRSALDDLLSTHGRVALCLDFDGTLAPIVEVPDDATMLPGIREHLAALADHPNVDVAVISGRALEEVRSRVDVDGLDYAGNHGFERLQDGRQAVHPGVERHRDTLERVRDEVRREVGSIPGCIVEDKHATATVHYRQAADEDVHRIAATVERIVEAEDGLRVTDGDQVKEVRPAVDQGKGVAMRQLIEPDADTLAIYVGDDRTDVDAFEAMAAMDGTGVAVAVGEHLEGADHRLDDPTAVRSFLAWLREAVPVGD